MFGHPALCGHAMAVYVNEANSALMGLKKPYLIGYFIYNTTYF
jgi:hypothetical protein